MARYYYNGVLLPEIPADVLEEYPYCWIRNDGANAKYNLVFAATPWYYNGINHTKGNTSARIPYYSISFSGYENAETWGTAEYSSYEFGLASNRTVMWSNHDIPNGSATSTTIYFYGSEPVPEIPPFDKKYLLRSGSTLYTITDGAITPLTETEITASLFRTYGVDEIPDGALLLGLTDPEVLYWHDSTDDLPTLTTTVTGSPPVPQVVVTNPQDMSDSTILGIESVTVTASEDVLFALSFDDGATWTAYNGTVWVTLEQENSGMTAETFQNISLEAWAEVVTGTAYRVRFVLMDTTSYMTELVIHYLNKEG